MFRKSLLALALVSSSLFAGDPVTERPSARTGSAVRPNSAPQSPATNRPAQNRAIGLPGSLWLGTEELNKNGRLDFGLHRNGIAVMIDAQSTIEGRWKTQGNDVILTFKTCVYRGSIQGNDLIGRGTFTEGENAGQSWAFRITHVNPYAGLTYTGTENLNGFGALSFQFGADGFAMMKDARGEARGAYTYDVGSITIRFVNCEYTGTIQPGNVFAGTARYTNDSTSGPWTFSVRLK